MGTLVDTDRLTQYDKEFIQPITKRATDDDIMEIILNNTSLDSISFATATDEQITSLIGMADKGYIDLSDYFHVGDVRPVHLSAMAASELGESHDEQDAELVILHGKDCFDLVDGGKNSFVIGLKDSLATGGAINAAATNVGGWKESARRPWCDNIFMKALPTEVQKWFKKFKYKASDGNQLTTSSEMENYFTLASRSEVFGGSNTSYTPASEDTTQFDYYKTAANRIKKYGITGSAWYWWLRSPYISNISDSCIMDANGILSSSYVSYERGLSPFGCI